MAPTTSQYPTQRLLWHSLYTAWKGVAVGNVCTTNSDWQLFHTTRDKQIVCRVRRRAKLDPLCGTVCTDVYCTATVGVQRHREDGARNVAASRSDENDFLAV